MQAELDEYRQRRILTARSLPRPAYSGELSRRVLSDGEAMYVLGDFAVERGQAKGALYIFDDFDKLALDSPRRAKVLSRRMIALMHDDDIEAAEVSADELMALDSADPEVLTDLAHYQLDRYVHARHTR